MGEVLRKVELPLDGDLPVLLNEADPLRRWFSEWSSTDVAVIVDTLMNDAQGKVETPISLDRRKLIASPG